MSQVAALVMLSVLTVMAGAVRVAGPGVLVTRRTRMRWRKGRPRPNIPARIRRAVLAAYGHRCAYCRAPGRDLDHVDPPYSFGGLTWRRNLVVLCHYHNMIKSNYWVSPDGRVWYRPWPGYDDIEEAARILEAELARRNPLRLARTYL